MAQSSKTLHHIHKTNPSMYQNSIEKLAYVAGIASPIATLPQVFQIWWLKDASGVSLITWISYLIIVTIMALYGILHKEKPLIIMYGSLILIDLLIIIGALIY